MKRVVVCLSVIFTVLLFSVNIFASEKGPVETVLEGCKKEIDAYCKNVKLGEGRMLACLYAHEDKLSGRCDYALYDAAAQLERAVAALTFLANECREDLKKFCSDIKPGQGRLLNCIDKNQKNLSGRCKQAIKDVSENR